jgi:hypothetical protein
MPRRTPLSGRIALRRLNFYYLASEVGQDHGGVGPSDNTGQVNYPSVRN